MEKPKDYRDIIALISFEDFPPIPAVGFVATENDHTVFFIKIDRMHVDWDRILAWKYLDDAWPEYMFYLGGDSKNE